MGATALVAAIVLAAIPASAARPAADDRRETLAGGLQIWRKLDKNGAACATCHSPDGIDLAAYNFDDATLMRRAYPHLGVEGGEAIVEYVHALRTAYGIKQLRDPMVDRPMQPGGAVLPGTTPAERDLAFGRTLSAHIPRLMGAPIDSLAAAQKARDEMLALNVRRVKIGIPMNRLSEDGYHGVDHASVADWIADVPVSLATSRLFPLQDAYLASPTDAGLEKLDEALVKDTARAQTPAQQMSLCKYRAMLIFQHDLRMKATGKPTVETKGPVALGAAGTRMLPNPLWEMAETGRQYADLSLESLGLPKDIEAKKRSGPTFADQMKQIRLSWYWAGWTMDQGLQRSGFQKETRRADYFSKLLLDDGPYPIHCAFMLTKKLATESFVPDAWLPGPAKQHLVLNYSFLLSRGNLASYEPQDPEQKKLFRTFVANSFRMNLYLLRDELKRTGAVDYQKEPVLQQISLIGEFLAKVDTPQAQDAALAKETEQLLQSATLKLPNA